MATSEVDVLENQGLSIIDLRNLITQIDKNVDAFANAIKKELEQKTHYEFIIKYLADKERMNGKNECKEETASVAP